jgi:hypothetical protein
MAAAVTPQDTVRLAQEAEEIRQKLARKEHDPQARLAEIEATLDEHWIHDCDVVLVGFKRQLINVVAHR